METQTFTVTFSIIGAEDHEKARQAIERAVGGNGEVLERIDAIEVRTEEILEAPAPIEEALEKTRSSLRMDHAMALDRMRWHRECVKRGINNGNLVYALTHQHKAAILRGEARGFEQALVRLGAEPSVRTSAEDI